MAIDSDDDSELARRELIDLLEDLDSWRITDSAFMQGRVALKEASGKTPSDCEMIDYFVVRLQSGFPIIRTPMGEPSGSRGVGWVMKNPDGKNTYIKLKIEEDGIRRIGWVISCHTSKHEEPS